METSIKSNNKNAVFKSILLGSRARIASVPVLSNDVYLVYGGWINSDNRSSLPFPFQAYDASTSVWSNLPLPPGSNYSSETNLINLGNDTIWIWGGTLNSTGGYIKNVLNTFDYRTTQWTTQIVGDWAVRESHTATLARNGLIYILGGKFKTNVPNYEYAKFSDVISFNTQTSQWGFINATNDQPTRRRAHTTTSIPNTDLLLVYGGLLNYQASGIHPLEDNCILFNTSDNSLKIINLPSAPNVPNGRYGHFATIYQSDLLILAFGFINSNVAANDLRILNISDPLNPTWLVNNQNDSPGSASGNSGMNKGQMIGTIVAVIVVSLVAAFSGWFFYIRYRRRQQRKEFTLQQEDPRKNFDNNANFELNELDDNLSRTYVASSQQVQYTKLSENTDNDQHNTTASTKPFEDTAVNKVKPFENQMDQTKLFNKNN
ncbi:unnamed protein product [Cunninghamella echinulata]